MKCNHPLRRLCLSQSVQCHFRKRCFSTQSALPQSVLNEEQKEFLTDNGYLWIKGFVPQNVARNVQRRINHLLDTFDPESTKSIFKTHRSDEQHKDLYFLESGTSNIRTLRDP